VIGFELQNFLTETTITPLLPLRILHTQKILIQTTPSRPKSVLIFAPAPPSLITPSLGFWRFLIHIYSSNRSEFRHFLTKRYCIYSAIRSLISKYHSVAKNMHTTCTLASAYPLHTFAVRWLLHCSARLNSQSSMSNQRVLLHIFL
jgi:hypothetical protein